MTRNQLRSLILKRLNELDEWYELDDPDPEKVIAKECDVLYEVASQMARAGFPHLHTIGLTTHNNDSPDAIKNYLSRCLKALRPERRHAATSSAPPSDCLTVIQAAMVAKVGKRTIYKLCEDGHLPYHRVGTGRGTIRIKRNDLDRYLQQNRVESHSSVREKDYLFS
jgi:excisionase family DNA binding protein